MYRHSLRRRVATAFGLCAAVLSIAWGLVAFSAIRLSEDRVLTRQLQLVAEDYAHRFASERSPTLPDTSYIQIYDEPNRLPLSLNSWASSQPEAGYYEFSAEELHVAVIAPDSTPQRAFVVFNVAGIEAASSEDWYWVAGITAVVVTLTILAFGLGMIVTRRAIAPVIQLARTVAGINPEKLTDDDWKRIHSDRFDDDEVGLLAATIEKTLERICAFVERERYFTSSASHELRTPVTVITGALELVERADLSSSDAKAFARIERATQDMRTIIEIFLSLSRETDAGIYEEWFGPFPIIQRAIEQHRYLLANKNIDVVVKQASGKDLYGNPQVFSVAVNNLIRNAFEHTLQDRGPVSVHLEDSAFIISNRNGTGQAKAAEGTKPFDTRGYGLGLGIVERLCEHNNWVFAFDDNNEHFDASLSWEDARAGETRRLSDIAP